MKRTGMGIVACSAFFMALCIAGCGPNSRDLCNSVQAGIRDVFYECGLPSGYTIVIAGTSEPACPSVNRVERREDIVNECLPWLSAVTCEEINFSDPLSSIPPFCSADHFVVVR